jgi:hypothetical protein
MRSELDIKPTQDFMLLSESLRRFKKVAAKLTAKKNTKNRLRKYFKIHKDLSIKFYTVLRQLEQIPNLKHNRAFLDLYTAYVNAQNMETIIIRKYNAKLKQVREYVNYPFINNK